MKQLYIILTFLLLSTTLCQGQNDPLTLAKLIFARDSFPNLDKHVTGEYNGHPNGTDLPTNVTTDFLLLGQDEKTAVINITITDSAKQAFDGYLHFVKDDVWKVTSFRALALTGMIAQIKDMLENMTEAQIDSTIEQSKTDTIGFAMFKSKEEYKLKLGNTRLTLASDKELVNHFNENKREFNRLKDSILIEIRNVKVDEEREMKVGEQFQSDCESLFISFITAGGYQFGECINFLIGGMVDNTVGYIYAPNKNDIPKMSPHRIIMLREIGNGWYLYKTT